MIDLRQTVSLTGIPNNSNLVIRPITKSRDQSVTVCVQLDSGQREVGEFRNDQSLWEIVGTLFPEKVLDSDNLEISCLYMRTEVIDLALQNLLNLNLNLKLNLFFPLQVSGSDKLQETKLNSLGILSGKVAIKLKITNLNAACASSAEPTKLSKITKDLDQRVNSFSNSIASKFEMLKQKLASKKKNSDGQSEKSESLSNVLEAPSNKPLYAVHHDLIEVCLIFTCCS